MLLVHAFRLIAGPTRQSPPTASVLNDTFPGLPEGRLWDPILVTAPADTRFLQFPHLSLSLSPIGSVSLENPNAGFGTENGSRRTEFEG